MHQVDYCQTRLIRNFLLFVAAGSLLAYLLPGEIALKWVVCGICFAAAALVGLKAFGDRGAVLWDQRGVTLVTLTGRHSVDWREVRDIGAQRITQYMFGVIPMNRWDFLTIKTRGGLLASKRYRISASLLELPAGGSAELAETLIRAHAAAMAGAAVPAAPAERRPQPVAEADSAGDSKFDPDAAIARYLARKAADPDPIAAVPGMPAAPARPVFGRKAV